MEGIGRKIKELRAKRGLTLKELSEKTNLSTGFLSQLERGLTTATIDSLESISEILGVDPGYFFNITRKENNYIARSYEREIFLSENPKFIQFNLSKNSNDKNMLPRIIEVLPNIHEVETKLYSHEGEEFVYVLEGILTLYLGHEVYELYPGDSVHIDSKIEHNWANYTNKITKVIIVNLPNIIKDIQYK